MDGMLPLRGGIVAGTAGMTRAKFTSASNESNDPNPHRMRFNGLIIIDPHILHFFQSRDFQLKSTSIEKA
jgi:hypothetical protein